MLGAGGVWRRATRACPVCGWEIRLEALKCRHCGSSVPPVRRAPVCWLCRIAAGLAGLLLIAGIVAFLLTAGGP